MTWIKEVMHALGLGGALLPTWIPSWPLESAVEAAVEPPPLVWGPGSSGAQGFMASLGVSRVTSALTNITPFHVRAIAL